APTSPLCLPAACPGVQVECGRAGDGSGLRQPHPRLWHAQLHQPQA
ncbi:hypothetical protein HaLaN_27738, partial [Haematococcus lacustris]